MDKMNLLLKDNPVVKLDHVTEVVSGEMQETAVKPKVKLLVVTHITQVSPVDVQKMSISDIGPILWMSVGEPRNIPTAETEIQRMSFF